MKIMLDVGSRNGESLETFVRYDFDLIHAFEPLAIHVDPALVIGQDDTPAAEVEPYALRYLILARPARRMLRRPLEPIVHTPPVVALR